MQPLAFWLGHWDVYADGKLDGHDFVESTLAGCAVLEDSTLAVGDVGIASGFDSRASFMRVIKRQLGQPASAIRRAARRDAAL